jgi:hypothetical protein
MTMQYFVASSQPIEMRNETSERLNETSERLDVHSSGLHREKAPSKHYSSPERKEMTKFESTADGDVVIVEDSFDDHENPAADKTAYVHGGAPDASASPIKKPVHRRDLSAHFYDATRLTDDGADIQDSQGYPVQHARPPHKTSPMRGSDGGAAAFAMAANQHPVSPAVRVGNKHRRGYSGGISNPAVAHRRINSVGDSAQVDRYGYYSGGYPYYHQSRPAYSAHRRDESAYAVHRREGSAGLDILSAVADESKEQVRQAAGHRRDPSIKTAWDSNSDTTECRMDPPPSVPNAHGRYEYPPATHSGYPGSFGYSASPQPPVYSSYHDAFYPPGSYPHPQAYQPPPEGAPYPIQYAPLKGGDTYESKAERLDTDERLFRKRESVPTTTGVQTFVTAIGVGDGNRTVIPTPAYRNTGTNTERNETENPPIPIAVGHHRKMSSYSSLGTLMGSGLFDPEHPVDGHHRSTSSSVSFLQGLDAEGDMFLQNLGAPPSHAVFSPPSKPYANARPLETTSQINVVASSEGSGRSLATGGTSKRIRRKCTMEGCSNRVVQGGLCIAHGARRKTCQHPGCSKNVKKAGLCSTHGPARKRCEHEGCSKVAVQGGRCIAHGAKKKLCKVRDCTKQAILSGMCKKHHDATNHLSVSSFVVIDESGMHKPSHTRGLSIFQEMSAESVQTLLSAADDSGPHPLKG